MLIRCRPEETYVQLPLANYKGARARIAYISILDTDVPGTKWAASQRKRLRDEVSLTSDIDSKLAYTRGHLRIA